MDISRLEAWLDQMERLREADVPFVEVDGIMYTPHEIVAHARANDQVWQRIQVARPDLDPEDYSIELLTQRIKQRYEEGRLATIYMIGYGEVTPERQIEEIQKQTPLGMEILQAEAGLLKELMP